MKKLILHVGPGKCGSSSIQHFFMNHKNPCVDQTKFILLNPNEISAIDQIDPSEDSINHFNKLLKNNTKQNNILILSHEYLFQCKYAIKNICSISMNIVSEILIIGYSRQQSDFIVSTYSQWEFRSSVMIEEIKDTMVKIGMEPMYFSGIERQLIALIVNEFNVSRQLSILWILNWKKSYEEIESLISPLGAKISCGILPDKHSSKNLIEDFCYKAGLIIKNKYKQSTGIKVNSRFNYDLIETINNATEFGLDVPTSHEDNQYIKKISQIMRPPSILNKEFLSILKQYIDSYFYTSNIEFCRKYGIKEDYFKTSKYIAKTDILKTIKDEEQRRISDDSTIRYYKKISAVMAETCLQLIKNKEK